MGGPEVDDLRARSVPPKFARLGYSSRLYSLKKYRRWRVLSANSRWSSFQPDTVNETRSFTAPLALVACSSI
jgi:hypothetical protein